MSSLAGAVGAGASAALATDTRLQILDAKGRDTILIFDATLEETYKGESNPTEFPIEDGSIISDHVIHKQFELPFKGIVTDHPLSPADGSGSARQLAAVAATAALPPLGVAALGAGYALASASDPSPSTAAYLKLSALRLSSTLLTIKTKMGTFGSMIIKDLSTPRNAASGSALEFTLTFTRIRTVKPQSVNVAQFSNPGLAAGRADIGEQSAITDRYDEGAAKEVEIETDVFGAR